MCTHVVHRTPRHAAPRNGIARTGRTKARIRPHQTDESAPAGRFPAVLNPSSREGVWVRTPPRAHIGVAVRLRGAPAIRRPLSTSSGLPASRHPTWRRSPTTTDGRDEQNERPRPRPHRGLRAVRRARRSRVATGCQRPPGLLVRLCRPTLREPLFVQPVLYSFPPPPLQELASGRHRVDDGDALSVFDHTNLQRFASSRRPNEHRDRWIVGLEGSPVMSN